VGEQARIQQGRLDISAPLHQVLEKEIAPGLDVSANDFWLGLEDMVTRLSENNRQLLQERDVLQIKIDEYHRKRYGAEHNAAEYRTFLKEIGYIVDEGDDFTITTENVDPEIALIAGPQLVVPVNNSRYAVNAVNGRWGSLYDALYGTDVISEGAGAEKGSDYNPIRGEKVISFGVDFLDHSVPLALGSHKEVVNYTIVSENDRTTLQMELSNGTRTTLQKPEQFIGIRQEGPLVILLKNNGLHLEIHIDKNHLVGSQSLSGIKDIILEAAVTTICDCEDSVSAVDGCDKALTYRNWLGLIKGDLIATFEKNGKSVQRSLNQERIYTTISGDTLTLSGRSVMLIRNVGHLMTTGAVLLDGQEIPEGMLDAMITGYISLHQLGGTVSHANSRYGSVYIVKPKMHGPAEVAFTCEIFSQVEKLLGLPVNTLKVGIMDEERRTSVNLKECIRMARERIIFINTGFLDRTGDEIHTSMEAGPMACKDDMKNSVWIEAYENRNVDIGLSVGFSGRAQIGKGMWAKPDMMAEMVQDKIGHPQSGAICAWVPSPTAATLHAMHYHKVNVFTVQEKLKSQKPRNSLDDLLTIPVLKKTLPKEAVQRELDNSCQSILGYVVRWVDQGIGCSKVPDITNVGLMEDRATLRISSQHLANWIHHGICSKEQVFETLKRMAAIVDKQNTSDPLYRPMVGAFESYAFQAACDLVFKGNDQPNGYTEPILHRSRTEAKKNHGKSD